MSNEITHLSILPKYPTSTSCSTHKAASLPSGNAQYNSYVLGGIA